MPAIEREGDKNNGGAPVVMSLQKTVYVNGRPVSVVGSAVAGHGRRHGSNHKTVTGSSNVFVAGIPVNRIGDKDTCGHVRIEGSPDVYVNG
jgi:uncharacterized Zn-binding protein involved in type VI secretion